MGPMKYKNSGRLKISPELKKALESWRTQGPQTQDVIELLIHVEQLTRSASGTKSAISAAISLLILAAEPGAVED